MQEFLNRDMQVEELPVLSDADWVSVVTQHSDELRERIVAMTEGNRRELIHRLKGCEALQAIRRNEVLLNQVIRSSRCRIRVATHAQAVHAEGVQSLASLHERDDLTAGEQRLLEVKGTNADKQSFSALFWNMSWLGYLEEEFDVWLQRITSTESSPVMVLADFPPHGWTSDISSRFNAEMVVNGFHVWRTSGEATVAVQTLSDQDPCFTQLQPWSWSTSSSFGGSSGDRDLDIGWEVISFELPTVQVRNRLTEGDETLDRRVQWCGKSVFTLMITHIGSSAMDRARRSDGQETLRKMVSDSLDLNVDLVLGVGAPALRSNAEGPTAYGDPGGDSFRLASYDSFLEQAFDYKCKEWNRGPDKLFEENKVSFTLCTSSLRTAGVGESKETELIQSQRDAGVRHLDASLRDSFVIVMHNGTSSQATKARTRSAEQVRGIGNLFHEGDPPHASLRGVQSSGIEVAAPSVVGHYDNIMKMNKEPHELDSRLDCLEQLALDLASPSNDQTTGDVVPRDYVVRVITKNLLVTPDQFTAEDRELHSVYQQFYSYPVAIFMGSIWTKSTRDNRSVEGAERHRLKLRNYTDARRTATRSDESAPPPVAPGVYSTADFVGATPIGMPLPSVPTEPPTRSDEPETSGGASAVRPRGTVIGDLTTTSGISLTDTPAQAGGFGVSPQDAKAKGKRSSLNRTTWADYHADQATAEIARHDSILAKGKKGDAKGSAKGKTKDKGKKKDGHKGKDKGKEKGQKGKDYKSGKRSHASLSPGPPNRPPPQPGQSAGSSSRWDGAAYRPPSPKGARPEASSRGWSPSLSLKRPSWADHNRPPGMPPMMPEESQRITRPWVPSNIPTPFVFRPSLPNVSARPRSFYPEPPEYSNEGAGQMMAEMIASQVQEPSQSAVAAQGEGHSTRTDEESAPSVPPVARSRSGSRVRRVWGKGGLRTYVTSPDPQEDASDPPVAP